MDNPLHRARVQLGIDLPDLAGRTCLSPHIVQKIDAGRFDELPSGIYARSYVRAFASAVALDPEVVVRDLEDCLPRAEDPFPVLRDTANREGSTWMAQLTARKRQAAAWLVQETHRLASLPAGIKGRRVAAALFDAAVLLVLHVCLVWLTAWASGVPAMEVLELAGGSVTLVWAVLVFLYFGLLGGIGGRTPGAWVLRVPAGARTTPLRLRSIVNRAFLY